MDNTRIRELQSLISEGRVECQQANNDWNRKKDEISVALEDASRIEARLLTVIRAYVYAWLELGDECKRSGKARVAERMSELYWCMMKYRLQKDKLDKTRSRLKGDIDELTDKMKSMESIYNELEKELEAEGCERCATTTLHIF